MERLGNLEKLRPEAAKPLEPYVRGILALTRNEILSVIVFGSATGPNFIPGHSNVNLALLVREVDSLLLKKCLRHVSSGFKDRIVAPLFLTRDYIESSMDVFPVEFLDMRETAVVLFGDNPFGDLKLRDDSLRLECEQQLKGLLLRVRQAYLELGLTMRGLEKVLTDSLNSLVPVLRAMLFLKGRDLPAEKMEIVRTACAEFGIPSGTFETILRLKFEQKRVRSEDEDALVRTYMEGLQTLALTIDSFHVRSHP